jgi:ParB family chromosome partitioning protein
MNIDLIKLTKILPPAFDQRSEFDETADLELLESIKQFGVLEPILVRPKDGQFEIIAGHRRYRMASRAGLPTIPCISQKTGDKETELIKIHENIHRLPLSHVDQGNTFFYLRSQFDMTEAEIAALVGKSVPYISQHLSLISSDPYVLESVKKEEITFSAARELNQVADISERKRLLSIVKESGATVPVIQNWVREANRLSSDDLHHHTYSVDDAPQPVYTDPTFPCESCNTITHISKMHIVRLCPDCDFNFKNAISLIHAEETAKNQS